MLRTFSGFQKSSYASLSNSNVHVLKVPWISSSAYLYMRDFRALTRYLRITARVTAPCGIQKFLLIELHTVHTSLLKSFTADGIIQMLPVSGG